MTQLKFRNSILLFAAITLATPALFGQTAKLELKPYSGSVLMSRAIYSGRVQLAKPGISLTDGAQVSCSPSPCVLPNVQASGGPNPVNEDAMAVNPKNNLQLATTGNDYNCTPTLQVLQGIHTSNDGGTTWKHGCMKVLAGNQGFGDIIPGYDTKGTLFVVGIDSPDGAATGTIVFQKSTNNGTTFSAPKKAVLNPFGGLPDKPWLEVDTNPTSPLVNSLYISATQFAPNNDSQISVNSSHNGGTTWKQVLVSPIQHFPAGVAQFSDLAVGADGTVYLTYMVCPANGPTGDCGGTTATMFMQKSTDGGTTWSTPVTMIKVKLAPDTCGAFYGCIPKTSERVSNIPVIAADPTTKGATTKLYTTLYTMVGAAMRVQVVKSVNGGATWSTKKAVAPVSAKGDEFFPWINVNATGQVGVNWLDRRNDPANHNYEAFAAYSTNSGLTYSTNVKLSSTASDPNNDGFGGGFMGDYTGSGWAGNTNYYTYMDTRTGVSQDELSGASR